VDKDGFNWDEAGLHRVGEPLLSSWSGVQFPEAYIIPDNKLVLPSDNLSKTNFKRKKK
jgi:hypothetical protein